MARRREARQSAALSSQRAASRPLLETVSQIAQIALAVVAIFGYFYTVRPIYQKERLAEQVAEYDGIIKQQRPKIVEIERRLAELQLERDTLVAQMQSERQRLISELKAIEHELVLARAEKNRIESQTEFMTFRYRLPDGSPAKTREQVQVAQSLELKRAFFSSLITSCGYGLGSAASAFPRYSYETAKADDEHWPFTQQELAAWKEQGAKYPLNRAIACIDSAASRFAKRSGQERFADYIAALHTSAVEFANRAGATPWRPPLQAEVLLEELAAKRTAIQKELVAELKKVEEEYGNWQSTFGASRRAIYEHNYRVGKQNAETQAKVGRMNLEYEMQQKANALRKSTYEEIDRLILRDSPTAAE